MTVTLALVGPTDLPPEHRIGGMQAVRATLARAAWAAGVPVVTNPSLDAVRDLAAHGSVLVFTQKGVPLTAEYRRWAESCLVAGATVVEKNVFALPSVHRPIHPRYVHGLMSMDGAHRFVWRSVTAGLTYPPTFALIPNPVMVDAADTRPAADPARVRLLRAGRPDPVKWTTWEQELAVAMAFARPRSRIDLVLLGAPSSCRLPSGPRPANLRIIRQPVAEVTELAGEYAAAAGYLLTSRIGETYGNTLAEAQSAGCFVVAGLDPTRDCAPLEFLTPERSWTGAPSRALSQAGAILDAVVAAPARRPERESAAHAEAYLRMLMRLVDEPAPRPLPTRVEALGYLRDVGRRLDGRRGAVRAPVLEAMRAVKNRVGHAWGADS